jgi:transposase
MLHELYRQGLTIQAIAERLGLDRKTVRQYVQQGLDPPIYRPRQRRAGILAHYQEFFRPGLASIRSSVVGGFGGSYVNGATRAVIRR